MKQKNIHLLGLSLLTLSTSAFSMQFTSTINKLKLPLLMSVEQPPAIKYVPPGSMYVTARRMCGDGDVAHFHAEHPNFDFVPSNQERLDVIIGYWVVKDGETSINPTKENWFPIAYSKVKIETSLTANSEIGRFLPFTHSPIGPSTNGLQIVRDELEKLHDVSSKRFENTTNYKTYASVISCVGPDDSQHITPEGQGEITPSPLDIVKSLDLIVAGSFNEKTSKIKISINQSSKNYKFEIGETGHDLSGKLFDTFKQIMEIKWTDPKDLDEYKKENSLINLAESLKGLSGDKIDYCNKMGAQSHRQQKQYAFELFPMNLSCKKLFSDSDLVNAFNALVNPTEKPDKNDFEIRQKKLAERFLIAAALEKAQEKLDDPTKIVKTGCFPRSGQRPIDRIVASYPLKFIPKTVTGGLAYDLKANDYNHLHPESLFAIRDFATYFGADFRAIWGQVVPGQAITQPQINSNYAISLNWPVSGPNPLVSSFASVQLNINFKTRSVGGSCNGTIYC